jgi:hypothetical protein
MKNLKDITRDEIKISEIVKSFPIVEEVFLINSNWPYILNILKRKFGFNNPEISANEYNLEINEALEAVQTGKPTSITVVAPSAPSAATSATPFATPSATPAATPSTGLLASFLGSTTTTAPPSTPGPAETVTSTTPSLMNDIPDATGASSGFQYEENDNSLTILNPKGDIVYIQIGMSGSLKKVFFSTTSNTQGNFKAFDFRITSGTISFRKFQTDFFQGNTFVYNQMFGADSSYAKIYDHLKSNFSLTNINSGDLKKVQQEILLHISVQFVYFFVQASITLFSLSFKLSSICFILDVELYIFSSIFCILSKTFFSSVSWFCIRMFKVFIAPALFAVAFCCCSTIISSFIFSISFNLSFLSFINLSLFFSSSSTS